MDIAHTRLEFATGTVANLTASRVSTERIRKMRFFQEREYISLDFTRQDVLQVRVAAGGVQPEIKFDQLPTVREEPLHAELRAFLASVRTRREPAVDGAAGRRALELADRVMAGILGTCYARVKLGAFAPQEFSMIPRTLVPTDVRSVYRRHDGATRRNSRCAAFRPIWTTVRSCLRELSDAPPLDGKTTIPSHLPLGVLVDRTLVSRSMPRNSLRNSVQSRNIFLSTFSIRVL